MKVCQTFEGMSKYEGLSKLKGYVKIAYESMSNFWWYVKLLEVCHIFYVTLLRVSHTFLEACHIKLSHFRRYFQGMSHLNACHIKSVTL